MDTISIAIDGPSGAGKSSLARQAAAALSYLYVDTGAIYRTIACYVLHQKIDPADEAAVIAALPQDSRWNSPMGPTGCSICTLTGRT